METLTPRLSLSMPIQGSMRTRTWKSTSGRGRQGPEFLQRSSGVATGLGAVNEDMLPTGVRNMRNIELVPA